MTEDSSIVEDAGMLAVRALEILALPKLVSSPLPSFWQVDRFDNKNYINAINKIDKKCVYKLLYFGMIYHSLGIKGNFSG